MTDGIVVREEGVEASGEIADLESTSFDGPWSLEALATLLGDGQTRAWVARSTSRVVGAAILRVVAGEGELLRIAVHPAERQRGIGSMLLGTVVSAVADACPHGIHLEVRDSNGAARRLYARHGFVDSGRRRDYYQSPREDAVLMQWRPLDTPRHSA